MKTLFECIVVAVQIFLALFGLVAGFVALAILLDTNCTEWKVGLLWMGISVGSLWLTMILG